MNFINIKMQNFLIIFESVESKVTFDTLINSTHREICIEVKLPDLPEIYILFRVMLLSSIPHIDAHVGG